MNSKKSTKLTQDAYIISVDMGYGHQRATYPLRHLAPDGLIIHADDYDGMPAKDRDIWVQSRQFYEKVSRFKNVPLIGDIVWNVFDKFQEIKSFYPKRDLSTPSMQLYSTMSMIKKRQWGKHLIEQLEKKPLPLVTSFFVIAHMADYHNYSEDIFLVICDADISRAWAPYQPAKSRIKYLAPSQRVVQRLQQYGVPERMIYYTGFPLPKELLGVKDHEILKQDVANRLHRLDPECKYINRYSEMLYDELGIDVCALKPDRPLTITFAVGGAGAQRKTGLEMIKSLRGRILNNDVRVILVPGTHMFIKQYFEHELATLGLEKEIGRGIQLLYHDDKYEYFAAFAQCMRQTDILWTKPSELSFYCALGLPIIMSEPIGSQEKFNKRWLLSIGAGIGQAQVAYTDEWLFDWLESGWFAESAMNGYFQAAKYGTDNIEKILSHHEQEIEEPNIVLQY